MTVVHAVYSQNPETGEYIGSVPDLPGCEVKATHPEDIETLLKCAIIAHIRASRELEFDEPKLGSRPIAIDIGDLP